MLSKPYMFDLEEVATIHKYLLELYDIWGHILCKLYMFEGGVNQWKTYIRNIFYMMSYVK